MTALLSAPWYFQAAFILFGGLLSGTALWWVLCRLTDYLVSRETQLDDPSIFYADDSRDPTKENT